eukprot:CAMPEP_0115531104 /NCGR_PEP_ID=MMETSP0271-20121206/84857_1 /TAXON_ID=71861 /ORGANISM="Scrippsiella trochoidea, Strain CCMP3099" /LENGTH=97 /DNA_ID=CAMNT_0002963291 /DNA_START=21 /DNA_END=311 /DNA_ORIENTATION=+
MTKALPSAAAEADLEHSATQEREHMPALNTRSWDSLDGQAGTESGSSEKSQDLIQVDVSKATCSNETSIPPDDLEQPVVTLRVFVVSTVFTFTWSFI